VCTSSYTLSSETEVREINVRRLLILIRRLALRDGADFVFLPNDIALRNSVRRQFNQTLSNMFVRGAFTGSTQDEAFQVVTDSSVNTPEMIDQGRFIVELRVAPSLPLEFLTVRLVQTGGEVLLSEEF
jgi:phage tail sheath protein FI